MNKHATEFVSLEEITKILNVVRKTTSIWVSCLKHFLYAQSVNLCTFGIWRGIWTVSRDVYIIFFLYFRLATMAGVQVDWWSRRLVVNLPQHVACHASHVLCFVSHVLCHVSHVTHTSFYEHHVCSEVVEWLDWYQQCPIMMGFYLMMASLKTADFPLYWSRTTFHKMSKSSSPLAMFVFIKTKLTPKFWFGSLVVDK